MTDTTTTDTRKQELDQLLGGFMSQGWRIESRTEYQAVIVKGHRPNHILHMILTLVTLGIWVLVWGAIVAFGGEQRKIVSV